MKLSRAILAVAAGLALMGTAACSPAATPGETAAPGTTAPGTTDAPAPSCTGETAQKVFKLAFNQTEQHPQFIAGVALGDALAEATECRYGIKVYPSEQLGTQADVVNNISDGSVEMMYIGGPVMEGFNADFIVFNLPYMFDSIPAQAAVFSDEAVMGDLKKSIEESKRITVLGALHAGVRNVYNSKQAIKSPADLSGLKVRVQQSESQVKMIELMGAVASPMGQGEVYGALQTGVLDGAENNETVFNALKHDEVAKFYSYTRHLMIPDYLLINTDALEGMGADKEVFLGLVPDSIKAADAGFQDFVATSRSNSEAVGAQFNDDVDVAAFKAAVQPLVSESINNPVRQALYDAVQAANAANPAG